MQDFRDLKVWELSRELAIEIYQATAAFPKDERYGLTSQIRRSCTSIPANIAEGCGRATSPDLIRFLHIALGSASELESHLILAHDLGFIDPAGFRPLLDRLARLKRMLGALIRTIRISNP
jgi:four helix bundle protein